MRRPKNFHRPAPFIRRCLGAALLAAALPVTAGTYTITLNAGDADGNTDATWTHTGTITVDEYNGLLTIGRDPFAIYRSLLEFNLGVLPDGETVTNAILRLQANKLDGFGPTLALGWIKHLDAASATGHPAADFSFDALDSGTTVATLIPNQISFVTRNSFDVTAAVMADHAANRSFSAFSMVEDANRLTWGYAAFCSEINSLCGWHPELVVTTAAVPVPAPLWLMGVGLATIFARMRRTGTAQG